MNKRYFSDCFLSLGEDHPLDVAIRSMTLDFELPSFFRDPHKFVPGNLDHFFEDVPSVVAAAIFEAISDEVPADPSIPLIYLRNNRLPSFVVAWFMAAMLTGGRRLGKATKFYRALHAIERYREFIMYPADPSIPEYILAGAGAVPTEHFAPGSGGVPSLDDLEKEAQRLREAAGSDVTKDAEGQPADDEDPHNVGFVDDKEDDD